MSNSSKGDEIVYRTRTGTKYHRAGCSYLRSSCKISLKSASEMLSPCSRCNPPVYKSEAAFDISSSNSSKSTVFASRDEERNKTIVSDISRNNNTLFGNLSSIGNITSNNLFSRNDDSRLLFNTIANNSINNSNSRTNNPINIYDRSESSSEEEKNKDEDSHVIGKNKSDLSKIVSDILKNDAGVLSTIKNIFDEKFIEKQNSLTAKVDELTKDKILQEEKIKNLENKLFKLENELNNKNTKIKSIEDSLINVRSSMLSIDSLEKDKAINFQNLQSFILNQKEINLQIENNLKKLNVVLIDKIPKIENILNMQIGLNKNTREKFNYLINENIEMKIKFDKLFINLHEDKLFNENHFSNKKNDNLNDNRPNLDLFNQSKIYKEKNEKSSDEFTEELRESKLLNENVSEEVENKKCFNFSIKKIKKSSLNNTII